jgi:hypothetical protein
MNTVQLTENFRHKLVDGDSRRFLLNISGHNYVAPLLLREINFEIGYFR